MPKAPFVLVCVESLCGVFVSGEFVLAHSLDLSALYENRTPPPLSKCLCWWHSSDPTALYYP